MTPKKPDWFEMTEGGDSYSGIQRVNKKLPIITLVVAGVVILGGSIFANANNEPAAVAETPTTSQSVAAQSTPAQSTPAKTSTSQNSEKKAGTTNSSNALPAPTVSNVPQRGEGREHEGREGGHERGEGGHERGEGGHENHDD